MRNGTIIVLAWPEGMVKNADSWYDFFLSKNGMYRVGHSAIILINNELESINYFDFGRYHTPNGFGRVRDEVTDPDLKILTKPKIKNNKLINLHSILLETADKKSTHGKGKMYASVMKKVSFTKSYNCAKKLQKKDMIVYGPLNIFGTNCSRFVSKLMFKSLKFSFKKLRLFLPITISPSPKRNVCIGNKEYYVIEHKKIKTIKKSFLKSYFTSIENY